MNGTELEHSSFITRASLGNLNEEQEWGGSGAVSQQLIELVLWLVLLWWLRNYQVPGISLGTERCSPYLLQELTVADQDSETMSASDFALLIKAPTLLI